MMTEDQAIAKAVKRYGKTDPSADDVLMAIFSRCEWVDASNGHKHKSHPDWDEYTMGRRYHRLASEVIKRAESVKAKRSRARGGGRPRSVFTDAQIEWIVEQYRSGRSVASIRRELGVGFVRVRNLLRSLGHDPYENSRHPGAAA